MSLSNARETMHPDSTGACGEGGNPLPQISPQSSREEEKALDDLSLDDLSVDDLSLDDVKETSEKVLLDYEYMALIWGIHPRRLKFCDEIVVTGLDPFFTAQAGTPSGRAELVCTSSDSRASACYSIIGFCGIDRRTRPVDYCINTGMTDAEAFCEAVDFALIRGFLMPGDVLIVDNATLHKLPDSESQKKHMLSHHGVILLGLPLGSPDLNPMKLLMDTLAHRLRQRLIVEPTSLQESHRVVHAITEVLGAISHPEIALYYKRQSYLL